MNDILSRLGDVSELYSGKYGVWSCVGVLRMLDAVSQQVLLKALFDDNVRKAARSLSVDEPHLYGMNKDGILIGGELIREYLTKPPSLWPLSTLEKKKPTLQQLKEWTWWRWHTVLVYVTGEDMDPREEPSKRVVQLLKKAKLMKGEEILEITEFGLEFLLKSRHSQIWTLVSVFAERNVDIFALLLTMSFCEEGKGYAVDQLTDKQRDALPVLGGLGLAYMRSKSSQHFYPTSLGIQAAFDTEEDHQKKEGPLVSLVLQTNFQLLAYTDFSKSALVVGILSLFCHLQCRLPNLIVGDVTRNSVRECVVERGIRVEHIVGFLQAHARQKLPTNVVSQIMLWAGEDEDRLLATPGSLVTFPSPQSYSRALSSALENNTPPVWQDESTLRLFLPDSNNYSAENAVRHHL